MVRKTDTVKKYEEVFYELLGDESLPLLDILTLMKCIERDVILLHGINDVTHILELSGIIYPIHDYYIPKNMTKINTNQDIKKERT